MNKITVRKFEGWRFECPHCRFTWYILPADMTFKPDDDQVHYVKCFICEKEFEVVK